MQRLEKMGEMKPMGAKFDVLLAAFLKNKIFRDVIRVDW
jgi:hypothetical protein